MPMGEMVGHCNFVVRRDVHRWISSGLCLFAVRGLVGALLEGEFNTINGGLNCPLCRCTRRQNDTSMFVSFF